MERCTVGVAPKDRLGVVLGVALGRLENSARKGCANIWVAVYLSSGSYLQHFYRGGDDFKITQTGSLRIRFTMTMSAREPFSPNSAWSKPRKSGA